LVGKVALFLSLALAALAGVALAAPRTVTINNTAPRLDSSGVILDGHDLTIRQLPDGSCKYEDEDKAATRLHPALY